MLVIAIYVGIVLACREAKRVGLDPLVVANIGIVAIFVALIGARIYYVICNWERYARQWAKIVNFSEGGMILHGGLLSGILVAVVLIRSYDLHFWTVADVWGPGLALGQAIMRGGCLLNGCCYGCESDSPLALYLPNIHGHYAYRYPSQILQSLANLLLFVFLWRARRRTPFRGFVFLMYLILYSIGRFFVEFTRAPALMVRGFRLAQIVSLATVFVAGALALHLWRGNPQLATEV
jgi:prolipoprotein diacylglyceryl transferase